MSSILPSSYYQLSSLQSGTSSTTSGSTTGSGTASLVQTLAEALSGSSGSGSSGSGSSDAYLLDLSPSAQSLLSASSSGSGSASTSTTFTLTSAQETKIEAIIEKYKNAPYDQATFDSIQNDLEAAGLGADQLSAQDQISSFNPTNTLLSALSGNYASLTTPGATQSNEATKASNYMQSILTDWKSVSTTASASSASGSATAKAV